MSTGEPQRTEEAPADLPPELDALMYALGTAACNCHHCIERRRHVGTWLAAHDATIAAQALMGVVPDIDDLDAAEAVTARAIQFECAAADLSSVLSLPGVQPRGAQ